MDPLGCALTLTSLCEASQHQPETNNDALTEADLIHLLFLPSTSTSTTLFREDDKDFIKNIYIKVQFMSLLYKSFINV